MEEENGRLEGSSERNEKEEVFTKIVRAGKRTYFFDVKATRHEDLYLTITESKKRLGKEGKMFYEKHKIFLYKEDFEKFTEGLKDAVAYIDNGRNETEAKAPVEGITAGSTKETLAAEEFTNIEFDDLGKK